jgi:phosphatidylglycerophosphate synthase
MLAAPVIALAVIAAGPGGESAVYWATLAFVLYVSAALTDLLDGALARAWNVTSPLGATLDLLADKMIVAITLLALIYLHVTGDAAPSRFASGAVSRPIEAAGFVLLLLALPGRDLAVTALRARAAKTHSDGNARSSGNDDADLAASRSPPSGVVTSGLAPSGLAKAKTALVLTGLGLIIAAIWLASLGTALTIARIAYGAGWALLAVGAALSIWTAIDYWRTAKRAAG